MQTFIRSTLLIASIGGGFMGCVSALNYFFAFSSWTIGGAIVNGLALTVFIYTLYAGLQFSKSASNTKQLSRAFLLQVPWLSSPILMYKIGTGISLAFMYSSHGGNYFFSLGANYSMAIFSDRPWGIGVNLAAIGFLMLIKLYKK
ncbi:hypothetical protein P3339_14335 [Microbulbifer sp. MLAF003]|uniref:hypothetical protein n=1 Tax=unclassified Microbulbifer TaxID=2619833 RepID=UPI0024AE0181|nr:hypothetical protein [Microbulbifer sp. MLAF003]WHI49648.1 hypothetical protein P3339_14335 [Microbulbifer sp. MLAF003]